jgi:hypothetical protein
VLDKAFQRLALSVTLDLGPQIEFVMARKGSTWHEDADSDEAPPCLGSPSVGSSTGEASTRFKKLSVLFGA